MAVIIDGKAVSSRIKDEVKKEVAEYRKNNNKEICLAVLIVGENPASKIYVRNKANACEYVGIKSVTVCMPESSTQTEIEEQVKTLAENDDIDGILVQLPLPKGIDEAAVLSKIPQEKDVDCFLPVNLGKILIGNETVSPCTPAGIIELIKSYGIKTEGKRSVVIGRSNIVGKPVSLLLLKENCTVTICHSKTVNLSAITSEADIVVCAIGKPEFLRGDMVKDGVVVIDVGINRTENGLKGDVCFEEVEKKASYITPVPGGVGPMTIAMLMKNTLMLAKERRSGKL